MASVLLLLTLLCLVYAPAFRAWRSAPASPASGSRNVEPKYVEPENVEPENVEREYVEVGLRDLERLLARHARRRHR